ncbi:MAG: sigma-70 family RNA polymerase sigma factor [Planctomycetes bacterium]|nr:sigma-70 family RNA polymerase sigma factor [Planctomycetota bacterium]
MPTRKPRTSVLKPVSSTLNLASFDSISSAVQPRQNILSRIRHWIETEIKYVDHPLFKGTSFLESVAELRPESIDRPQPIEPIGEGQAFVSELVATPLLSREEERFLFLWMNGLKKRAERNRKRLSLNCPDASRLNRVESDMQQAIDARNRLVQANVRLVVSLARKLSKGPNGDLVDQMSELTCEGMIPLIRAVELFDVGLGYRFSTYATWAVRNQMFRTLKRKSSNIVTSVDPAGDLFARLTDRNSTESDFPSDTRDDNNNVLRLLSTLSPREQKIIQLRFGLGGASEGMSFNEIARQMNLSKERIRQILLGSLEKLADASD